MSMNVAEVEQAMLALDRHDLAAVIHRGIQALDRGDDQTQDQIDTAWRDELSRRIDDLHSGRVTTISVEESFSRARSALTALHR